MKKRRYNAGGQCRKDNEVGDPHLKTLVSIGEPTAEWPKKSMKKSGVQTMSKFC
jgi:hypothetical protein